LAERHEKAHFATFPEALDLSAFPWEEREARTREAVTTGVPVIYQGVLRAAADLNGVACEIVGDPDFLIRTDDSYVIRDSKISKRINEDDHPEIIYQLQLYGWLYEQVFGRRPMKLEVHSGPGDIVLIDYDGGRRALDILGQIVGLKRAASEFYSPVGWTKCGDCGFFDRCWPRAQEKSDVALVPGVDQTLARILHERGISTLHDLLQLPESELADIQLPRGRGTQRVGKRSEQILRSAQALAANQEISLRPPEIPDHPNYVIFDLEGLPPQLDELEKIYLWGLQVYGERSGPYQAAIAGFGVDGDRHGWEDFLRLARGVFQQYGDLPLVHWSHYERTKLDLYTQRFGDPHGTAARVRKNLLDLLPVTQRALVLPLPSYSLKVIEGYIGFQRDMPEANGEWAMARYIEAVETEDMQGRGSLIAGIRAYNEEDLKATWAVLQWLRAKRGGRTR